MKNARSRQRSFSGGGSCPQDLQDGDLEIHPARASRGHRHMVGTSERALRPTCLRSSGEASPLVAASKIFEATWARVPVSFRETFSQTSSRIVRRSAVVAESNMGDPRLQNHLRAFNTREFKSVNYSKKP